MHSNWMFKITWLFLTNRAALFQRSAATLCWNLLMTSGLRFDSHRRHIDLGIDRGIRNDTLSTKSRHWIEPLLDDGFFALNDRRSIRAKFIWNAIPLSKQFPVRFLKMKKAFQTEIEISFFGAAPPTPTKIFSYKRLLLPFSLSLSLSVNFSVSNLVSAFPSFYIRDPWSLSVCLSVCTGVRIIKPFWALKGN